MNISDKQIKFKKQINNSIALARFRRFGREIQKGLCLGSEWETWWPNKKCKFSCTKNVCVFLNAEVFYSTIKQIYRKVK